MRRALSILAIGATALTTAAPAFAAPQSAGARQYAVQHADQKAARQPVVSGFYKDKTVRYFNYGPIKLRPGNKVAPIWSVTNGPKGQHNIIDCFPARRATRRSGLLTSFAAIDKAKAAGDVTIARTSLVVNCPIVP